MASVVDIQPRGFCYHALVDLARVQMLVGVIVVASSLAARAQITTPTVTIDLTALSGSTIKRLRGAGLGKQMIRRLTQEGFARATPDATPTIRLRLVDDASGIIIEAAGPGGQERRVITIGDEPASELRLEIVQKGIALAHRVEQAPPPPSAPVVPRALEPPPLPPAPAMRHELQPPPPPSPTTKRITPAPAPPSPAPSTSWRATTARRALPLAGVVEFSLGADVLFRSGGTDPLPRLGIRIDLGRSLGFYLAGGIAPSEGQAIHVLEAQVQAGAGYRIGLADRFYFEPIILAGILFHGYSLSDVRVLDPAGLRAGVMLSLPLVVGWIPHPALALEFNATPGWTDIVSHHALAGTILWRRGSWRCQTGLSFIVRIR